MQLEERPNCPMCGSAETRTIYICPYNREPMVGFLNFVYPTFAAECLSELGEAEYRLDECDGCHGIFQRFTGDLEFQERLYARWVEPEAYHDTHHVHDVRYYLRRAQEVMSLLRYFESQEKVARTLRVREADGTRSVPATKSAAKTWSPRELKVLDYGMGWGEFCQMVRGFGCEAYGYDLSPQAMERARRQALHVVEDVERSTIPFDVINAEQVFEHLVDPSDTLQMLSRHLSPNGVIRICVPSARRIHANLKMETFTADRRTKQSLNPVWPLEHVNCFAGDSLAEMGRRAGLVPFSIGDGLPIGLRGALKEAVRPMLNWLGVRMKNVCYYRLPKAAEISQSLRRAA